MAITVVSSASQAAAAGKAATAASSSAAGDSGGFDFAALLSGQMAAAAPGLGLGAGTEGEKKSGKDEQPADLPLTADMLAPEAPIILPGLPIVPPQPAATPAVTTAEGELGAGGSQSADPTLAALARTPGASEQAPGGRADLMAKAAQQGAAETTQPTAADEGGRSKGLAAALDPTAAKPGEPAIIAGEAKPAAGNSEPGTNFASLLAAQTAQHTHAPTHTEHPSNLPEIPTPVGDGRWAKDLGDKVVWMAKGDMQSAQININPPQLGPMQITLSLNGDQATASFASPHAEVRQAINDAMPQLREMLAGAGINLGQSNVGAQLPQQQQNNNAQQQFAGGNPNRSGDDKAILQADSGRAMDLPPVALQRGRGMVDLFA